MSCNIQSGSVLCSGWFLSFPPILLSTQSPRVNSYPSSMTARRKCRKIDFLKKRQCRDKGQKSDFYVFFSICFCQIPFTMLTMFVPVIRKTVSRFPCSLIFFFSVPLEIGHVPLFPQTPGTPSQFSEIQAEIFNSVISIVTYTIMIQIADFGIKYCFGDI